MLYLDGRRPALRRQLHPLALGKVEMMQELIGWDEANLLDERPTASHGHMVQIRTIRNKLFNFLLRHHVLRSMTLRHPNFVEVIVTGTPATRSTSSTNRSVSSVSCSNL